MVSVHRTIKHQFHDNILYFWYYYTHLLAKKSFNPIKGKGHDVSFRNQKQLKSKSFPLTNVAVQIKKHQKSSSNC